MPDFNFTKKTVTVETATVTAATVHAARATAEASDDWAGDLDGETLHTESHVDLGAQSEPPTAPS